MKTSTTFFQTLRGLFLLFLIFPAVGMAQGRGPASVRGTLLDQATGQPLPFADVLVLRAADSTFVTGAQTSDQGVFAATDLAYGTYLVRAQALNYSPARQRLTLTAAAPAAQLGAWKLSSSATKLAEVVVTGEKATVVEELGKRVINVEKDLSSIGGTAVNVLQNVPSVAVDARGVVSMRGTTNLTILIDGKPAGTGNGGTGARLDQIPASQISQVEVITNPSAKYDASGGGVINIITKKEKRNGFNGQAGVLVGTGDKYTSNLSLNRRQGKANWNMSYSGRDQRFVETTDNQQVATLPTGEVVRARQTGTEIDLPTNHRVSVGLDYELNKQNSLSFNVTPALEQNNEVGQSQLRQQVDGGNATTQNGRQSLKVDVKVLNTSADFRHTWAEHKGRELTANAGLVAIDAVAPVTQTISGGTMTDWRQNMTAQMNIFYGKVDYVHPLANGKSRFETGAKLQGSISNGAAEMQLPVDGRPGEYVTNAERSVAYRFEEMLPAAYATFQHQLGHGWSAQGGLRTEYTSINGLVKNRGGSFDVKYLNFFPSATVARELGAKPGQQKAQVSYARRLNRPDFMQQLPFQFYQDPLNYRTGNPSVRAEFTHNAELGYQLNLESGASLTTTLFGRFTEDALQRVRSVDTAATRRNGGAGLVTAETVRNLGTVTNLGAEVTWNQPLAAWWRVAATGALFRNEVAVNAGNARNRAALAGNLRLTNNFQFSKTFDVQLSGSFRSTTLTAQGRQLPTGGLDIAMRKRLFSDRAALTFRVSDILNTQVRNFEVNTPELTATYHSKPETRVGWLGFTWYLGATKPGKRIDAAPQGGGGFGG